jgi:23S rRNA G2069 N7-methylase RlmK/C1962 C5-methylase RlmI
MPPFPDPWSPIHAERVKSVLQRKHAELVEELVEASSAEAPCVRLFAGRADGRDGLFIDRFGPLVVVTDYARSAGFAAAVEEATHELVGFLRGLAGDVEVIVRVRSDGDGQEAFHCRRFRPAHEVSLPRVANERGLRFEIGIDPAHDFGLFLDAAKARQYVRNIASGKVVLNLFSYAAAFGVAASVGGAESVTNVDPNRDYLAWGKRNAVLNNVQLRILPDTAQVFLRRHLRRLERGADAPASSPPRPFDLVIVDPPAFGVGRGQERILRLLWPELFAAFRAMKPRDLVILCNDKYFRSRTRFEEFVRDELGGDYSFRRLGTCLSVGEVNPATSPSLDFKTGLDDPYFMEPIVLAGTRRSPPWES